MTDARLGMPCGTLKVEAAGLLTTIQDRGRHGLRRFGVPTAGTLAPTWMSISNALVGNSADTPVLEIFEGGLKLRASRHAVRIAHAGDGDVVLSLPDERRSLAPWRSHVIPPGAELAVRGSGHGRLVLLAIAGLSVDAVLGSASTYARARLGGIDGRPLRAGDALCINATDIHAADSGPHAHSADLGCAPYAPPQPPNGEPLRLQALPGPQQDAFEEQVLAQFFDTVWTLSSDADRMGARLEGSPIAHRSAAHRDIISDAIVPGSIQVPGSGLPIVMLADSHTAGGYPKIATLTSASLATLAIQRPGTRFTIERMAIDDAIDHTRQAAHALEAHLKTIHALLPDTLETSRLLSVNLVDGVTAGNLEEP